MWQNTKLLIVSSIGVMFLGLGSLWFGWNNARQPVLLHSSPVAESVSNKLVSTNQATSSSVAATDRKRVLVTRVVDGDTIVVNDKMTVRFVGVDTPETVDPRRPVDCFGKEASNETKSLLTGKRVILEKDTSETDKYGRLLRLIYLPLDNGQTLFVNDYLVREGFARVKTYPPDFKFESRFLEAEQQAKINKKGLWSKCEKI